MRASPDDVWLGQGRRRRAMDVILGLAKEHCPQPYSKFVSMVSYITGLSRRKIGEDYLVVLLDIGMLKMDRGIISVVEPSPKSD
jgi:hypothetical protein